MPTLPFPKVQFPNDPKLLQNYRRLLQAVLHLDVDIRYSLCSALVVDPSLRPFGSEEDRRALANLISTSVPAVQDWLASTVGSEVLVNLDLLQYRRQWVQQLIKDLELSRLTAWSDLPIVSFMKYRTGEVNVRTGSR